MHLRTAALGSFGALVEPERPDQDIHAVDVDALREFVLREQLIVLRGFRSFDSSDALADFCERWGEVSVWPFGKVLDLVEQDNPTDHIFDSSYIPLHWDGMYRPQVPEYQVFHCVKAPLPGDGGRTTFSNTRLALDHASPESRNLWSKVVGIYRRNMAFYSSETVSPIITRHPHRGFTVIRYNEPPAAEEGPFVNPPDLEFTGLADAEYDRFHRDLRKALYAPSSLYAHEWQQGDVVIADNFSLLHGRERFSPKAPRHLRRAHVLSDPPLENPGLKAYECPPE